MVQKKIYKGKSIYEIFFYFFLKYGKKLAKKRKELAIRKNQIKPIRQRNSRRKSTLLKYRKDILSEKLELKPLAKPKKELAKIKVKK